MYEHRKFLRTKREDELYSTFINAHSNSSSYFFFLIKGLWHTQIHVRKILTSNADFWILGINADLYAVQIYLPVCTGLLKTIDQEKKVCMPKALSHHFDVAISAGRIRQPIRQPIHLNGLPLRVCRPKKETTDLPTKCRMYEKFYYTKTNRNSLDINEKNNNNNKRISLSIII